MIIIAVAVLLLAWGVYSMTNAGNNSAPVAEQTSNKQDGNAPAAPASSAPAQDSKGEAATPAATPHENSATSAATANNPAAGSGAATSAEETKIFALNNSTVQGLANRVADELKQKGFNDVESGNFPDEVLPKSVAFFTPGNATEEAAARQIADQLGITAQPRIDALKDKPAGVVVVITEDLNR